MIDKPLKVSHVLTEKKDGQFKVIDPARGEVYTLVETAELIWTHCDGRTSTKELSQLFQDRYGMPPDVADEVLWLTLDYLEKIGLLADPVVGDRHIYSRRQVLKILATVGISVALVPAISSSAGASGTAGTEVSLPALQTGSSSPRPATTSTTSTTTTTTSTSTTTTTTTFTTGTTQDPSAITLLDTGAQKKSGARAGFIAAATALGIVTWRRLTKWRKL